MRALAPQNSSRKGTADDRVESDNRRETAVWPLALSVHSNESGRDGVGVAVFGINI